MCLWDSNGPRIVLVMILNICLGGVRQWRFQDIPSVIVTDFTAGQDTPSPETRLTTIGLLVPL